MEFQCYYYHSTSFLCRAMLHSALLVVLLSRLICTFVILLPELQALNVIIMVYLNVAQNYIIIWFEHFPI